MGSKELLKSSRKKHAPTSKRWIGKKNARLRKSNGLRKPKRGYMAHNWMKVSPIAIKQEFSRRDYYCGKKNL